MHLNASFAYSLYTWNKNCTKSTNNYTSKQLLVIQLLTKVCPALKHLAPIIKPLQEINTRAYLRDRLTQQAMCAVGRSWENGFPGGLVRRDYLLVATLSGSLLVLAGCGGSGSPPQPSSTSQPPSSSGTPGNPTPSIVSITPPSLVAGSASQMLTVNGSGFIASSVVNINGAALTTAYVSAASVTAAVPAALIAADGTEKVTVSNPAPGGGTSAVQSFTITELASLSQS